MDKIGPGTEEEVELRACSVHAVEKMRELISVKSGRQVSSFLCRVSPIHGLFAKHVEFHFLQVYLKFKCQKWNNTSLVILVVVFFFKYNWIILLNYLFSRNITHIKRNVALIGCYRWCVLCTSCSFYLKLKSLSDLNPGAQCGAGSLALGFWCSVHISAAPPYTFNILLSTWYMVTSSYQQFSCWTRKFWLF